MTAVAQIKAALAAGRHDEAQTLAEALVRAQPHDANAWNTLGVVLRVADLPWAAIAAYTRSLELAPDRPGVLSNLGNAWRDVQRFDRSIACHREAVAKAPDAANHWENLGVALRDAARYEDALAAYDRCIELDPAKPRNRFDRSHLLLMLGRYQEGWPEFEHRWALPELSPPLLTKPRWDGTPHPGAGDSRALADAMERLCVDDGLRSRLGKGGAAWATGQASWARRVETLLGALEACCPLT